MKQLILASCAVLILGGAAQAGPCNTSNKDAGSGPTPGYTGQTVTTGSANTKEHPPTETMNRVAGNVATSSQDAQRQQQGQPTAAQQAEGAKTAGRDDPSATSRSQDTQSAKMSDQGC